MENLPYNRPQIVGNELEYVADAIRGGHLSGNGPYSHRCAEWLADACGSSTVLMTSSCTDALEMAAILADVGPGDEVIMPSFTFVSTANAFVLRGATPVFVDIAADTLTIDTRAIAAAITERTRAIVPVHYAGVGCDMDAISEIASANGVLVIEDAAHGLLGRYRGRPLGGIGQLATLSFHETKNVICGEGGALLINDPAFSERSHILHEKGTNRRNFFLGEVDKYTWVDVGSSYVMSDLSAAFLYAQLEHAERMTAARLRLWEAYYEGLADLEAHGHLRRPVIPADCAHNAHLFYVLLPTREGRDRVLASLGESGISAVFHYVPLHDSPAGLRFGRTHGELPITTDLSGRLLRLPLWPGMTLSDIDRVTSVISDALRLTARASAVARR